MKDLIRLSAVEAATRLARRELSAEDYLGAFLDRIAEREPTVHAFAHLARDKALATARALDQGAVRGPLHGLPIGVKDMFDTFDMPTQGGSKIYVGHTTPVDAACIALSRHAGAVVLGKTVTTELATFPPNETRNPHNPAHTPGGSSSGSVAAVSDCMLPLATGTQTLGSTVRPAAYCGVIGYKPTYNLIPKRGVWATSDTLDTVGVFGKTVPDVAWFVAGMMSCPELRVPLEESEPTALRVGICRTFEWDKASPEMQQALEEAGQRLASAGAQVRDITLPASYADMLQAQITVGTFEMGRTLSDEYLRHGERMRPQLHERCALAWQVTLDEYQRALAIGRECRARIPEAFADVDVLLAPAATGEAPEGHDWTGDPVMNQVWSFLHTPCVSIPASLGPRGLPLGLQVIGRLDDDARTLRAAHWIQQQMAWQPFADAHAMRGRA